MSLICANCYKDIVVSNHPDHYGVCAGCGNTMTQAERFYAQKFIREHSMRKEG